MSITKTYFVSVGTSRENSADQGTKCLIEINRYDGNRIWYECHYHDTSIGPIGKISTIIPKSPEEPDQVLDCIIAFAPKLFSECKSLQGVQEKLKNASRLDFDLHPEDIPQEWEELRNQARKVVIRDKISF